YTDEPVFVKENVNLIYLGSMTENKLTMVIEKLRPYKERIKELIEADVPFLVTSNAMDLFGKYIEKNDGSKEEALGIFDFYVKRDLKNRFNGILKGTYLDMTILGFKTQFSMAYSDSFNEPFINVTKGVGMNQKVSVEGIHSHNFFATYLLGPFLVVNPLFTKHLLTVMGVDNPKLAFEEAAMEAYNTRLEEFNRPKLKYDGF
ncbi:MAG: hypothetical protein ACI4D8_07315, partial [Wujia sp.]